MSAGQGGGCRSGGAREGDVYIGTVAGEGKEGDAAKYYGDCAVSQGIGSRRRRRRDARSGHSGWGSRKI